MATRNLVRKTKAYTERDGGNRPLADFQLMPPLGSNIVAKGGLFKVIMALITDGRKSYIGFLRALTRQLMRERSRVVDG